MNKVWRAALHADPARRDREVLVAAALRLAMSGQSPSWDTLADPELRRRAGYLVDLAQHMRGQKPEEAAQLDRVRATLPCGSVGPFWPGDGATAAGSDPVAERWGYTRGVNVLRVRAALKALEKGRRIGLLPKAAKGRV